MMETKPTAQITPDALPNTGSRVMLLPETVKLLIVFVCELSFAMTNSRIFVGDIKYNTALIGHVFKSLYAKDMFSCSHECLEHNECESINYGVEPDKKGVCELNRGVDSDHELETYLMKRNDFVFVLSLRAVQVAKSCLEHFKMGMTTSGFYRIQGNSGVEYKAYCDMTSEPNSAWTLVLSYSFKNASQFRKSFLDNFPVSVDNPNWSQYRLSKGRMDDLKRISTHWRITCSFPVYGVDFRDYVRANVSAFDPTALNSNNACKMVELINIKGKSCQNCKASFTQTHADLSLHHVKNYCHYGESVDTLANVNEYFGNYKTKVDPRFRCTSGPEETTNMWFGGYI